MKAVVVYDSKYGNTEKIAVAVGAEIGGRVLLVNEVKLADLNESDLLVIGSPTHGGWYTEGIKQFLDSLPALEAASIAVFDTRTQKSLFGFAAPRMVRSLEKNGWNPTVPPGGFVVLGIKGPLKEGEIERATAWARAITLNIKEP
jgi:flavodoxin I